MSATQEKPFLNAILAQPEDDAPRLIFADWLDERGDSARAEFIRIQIQRANLPEWDPRSLRLWLRENALLSRHQRKWLTRLPKIEGVTFGEFRRGFVAMAAFASLATLHAKSSDCWAAAPIEAVSIPWPRPDESLENLETITGLRELHISDRFVEFRALERLSEAPLLSRLHTLEIRQKSLGSDGFRLLVASPHLQNLASLRVPYNSIGNGAAEALNKAPGLTSLTHLDLSETGSYGRYGEDPILEPSGLTALANWPGLARLRSLTLAGNDARREGLRDLLRSPHIAGLKTLDLKGNGLTGISMQEFESAHPDLKLEVLNLRENLLREVGAASLANSPCLRELKVLDVKRCEMFLGSARSLASSPFMNSLRILNVDDNGFGPDGLLALLEKRPMHLHTLSIANNDLGDEGMLYLANFPDLENLLEVNLSQNGLGDDAAKELASARHLTNLLVMRLKHNPIGNRARNALARSPLGKRLAILESDEH